MEYEGEGRRQGLEGIGKKGSPRDVGRRRAVDAARYTTSAGSVASDTVDPIGKPSGESHERQDSSTMERCRRKTYREKGTSDRRTSTSSWIF